VFTLEDVSNIPISDKIFFGNDSEKMSNIDIDEEIIKVKLSNYDPIKPQVLTNCHQGIEY